MSIYRSNYDDKSHYEWRVPHRGSPTIPMNQVGYPLSRVSQNLVGSQGCRPLTRVILLLGDFRQIGVSLFCACYRNCLLHFWNEASEETICFTPPIHHPLRKGGAKKGGPSPTRKGKVRRRTASPQTKNPQTNNIYESCKLRN